MGDVLRSIILGIIQGLTEFLPVSSSGHLELAKVILGDTSVPEQSLFLTVMLHVATALSTLFIFRKDVWSIIQGLFERPYNESQAFAVHVIISMIPAALVGFFMEPMIEVLFDKQVALVGMMLIVTAILLILADRSTATDKNVGPREALVIGLSQAIAIMPGISRSGATIATSVMLGVDRYSAARFSFLMVVPLILGKIAYDMVSGDFSVSGDDIVPVTAGFIAAFITGSVACKWMIALVRKAQLKYFAYYCIAVGVIALVLSMV